MNVLSAVLLGAVVILGLAVIVLVSRFSTYRATHPDTVSEVEDKRKISTRQSRTGHMGRIAQHFAPLLPGFADKFDFKDVRFMGEPIDYLVFDGLEAGHVKRIVFVEIKTGKSGLNQNQRLVLDAVRRGIPVDWDVVRMDQVDFDDDPEVRHSISEGTDDLLPGDSPPSLPTPS